MGPRTLIFAKLTYRNIRTCMKEMIGCHKKGIISYIHYCMILLGKKQKYSYKPIRTLQVYLCKQIFYVSFFDVPMCFSFRPVFTTSMKHLYLVLHAGTRWQKLGAWQKLTYGAPYCK
jgi:hypothetical protein